MPSPFHGIDTVSRALRAFQRGLDVTGHNLANVNTKGYSRQTVDYSVTDPVSFWGVHRIALGTGVGIAGVTRVQDMFLQSRTLTNQGELNRWQTKAQSLQQASSILGGPDSNAIVTNLSAFFNGWSALSANPSDTAARQNLKSAGDALTRTVRQTYAALEGVGANAQSQIGQTLARIDELTTEIARFNKAIRQETALGSSPNDLLDQRDQSLKELSSLIGIQTIPHDDGTVSVHSGSLALVETFNAFSFPQSYDAANFTVSDGSVTYRVTGGKLYGLFESVNAVNDYQTKLNSFAADLRDQVNALHRSGITGNATTNVDFFIADNPLVPAALNFDLSDDIKADFRNIAAGTSGNAGDGGLALSLSLLRDQSNAALGARTYSAFLVDMISDAGHTVAAAQDQATTQGAIGQQIEAQQQSISGVSVDDEMANMLRLQRSYQAAAKALSLFDQVTNDLINMI